MVGLLINGMPNYGVSARANADPIQNLNELAGKRFASVPAPSTAYAALEQLYRRAGLAPDIVQTSPAGLIAAAGQSDVYGAVLIEPWVSQVESEGGTVVLSMPDFYDDFALTGITASSRVQTENPQLIERFRNAIRNGVQTFYEDPDTTLQVAIARFPQESEEALRRGIERMREDEIYPRDLRVTQEAWEAAINLRIGSGDYGGSVEESWSVVSEMTR